MLKYLGGIGLGAVLGVAIIAGSSCVDKKIASEAADAGVVLPIIAPEGSMFAGTPTITCVNSQITDAVTQSINDGGMPELSKQ